MEGWKMKLSKESLDWAFAHLLKENDTDLFPEPLEIEIMNYKRDDLLHIVRAAIKLP